MDFSFFLSIIIFAFVMSVTPGPNNMMLLASGVQHGFFRTMPHMLGIILGMIFMNLSVLMGLGTLFELYPVLYDVLKVVGSAYLLWLAWRIANSSTDISSINIEGVKPHLSKNKVQSRKVRDQNHLHDVVSDNKKPMSLLSAALFQFVNPKAWTMSIGSMSTFTIAGSAYIESGLWVVVAFAIMGFIAISLWAGLGVFIKQWLTTEKSKRHFNWFMGGMTAATLALILT